MTDRQNMIEAVNIKGRKTFFPKPVWDRMTKRGKGKDGRYSGGWLPLNEQAYTVPGGSNVPDELKVHTGKKENAGHAANKLDVAAEVEKRVNEVREEYNERLKEKDARISELEKQMTEAGLLEVKGTVEEMAGEPGEGEQMNTDLPPVKKSKKSK